MKPCTFAGWLLGATSKNDKLYTNDEVNSLNVKIGVIAFILGNWVCGYFNEDARFFSVIYPNKADLTEHVSIGRFADYDECAVQSRKMLEQLGWFKNGTFRCSTSCNGVNDSPAHCI